MSNRVGKLLIAHPNLPKDNWFHKTVVYIYADDVEKGTLGIALNVKTSLSIKNLCSKKGIIYADADKSAYKGGPVAETSIMLFHSNEWSNANTITAGPNFSLTSDDTMFERISLGDCPACWKVIIGISGWAPGQLDLELSGNFPYTSANSWLTAEANDSIMFDYDGETQWKKALELSSNQMIDHYF